MRCASPESSKLTAATITHETYRRLRRMGLNPKYAGIKTEGDLFDLKFTAKGGS
ncbi:MAG: hypothetical protein IH848_09720 [Acidobacteria bacterium]|nr:hypothetical protein [Acidobacteriota bacterium]